MDLNSTISNLFFAFWNGIGQWFILTLTIFSVFILAIGIYELTARQ